MEITSRGYACLFEDAPGVIFFLVLAVLASPSFSQDDGCTAAAPVAVVANPGYSGYSFSAGSNNSAIERARLPDGVDLEIHFSGCADASVQEFVFVLTRSKTPRATTADWMVFAGKELSTLKLTDKGQAVRKSLQKFLKQASKLKALPGSDKVSACHDDSLPTVDGCSLQTGGGWEFDVRKSDKNVKISVTDYVNL